MTVLEALRKKAHIPQMELAAEVNVTQAHISQWENLHGIIPQPVEEAIRQYFTQKFKDDDVALSVLQHYGLQDDVDAD